MHIEVSYMHFQHVDRICWIHVGHDIVKSKIKTNMGMLFLFDVLNMSILSCPARGTHDTFNVLTTRDLRRGEELLANYVTGESTPFSQHFRRLFNVTCACCAACSRATQTAGLWQLVPLRGYSMFLNTDLINTKPFQTAVLIRVLPHTTPCL